MKFNIELTYQDLKAAVDSGALLNLADTVESAKPLQENTILSPGVMLATPASQTPSFPGPAEQPVQQIYPQQPPVPVYQAPSPQPAYQAPMQPAPAQQFPYQQQPAPVMTPAPAVPTTQPTYTIDQLAVAATQLNDAGRRQDLVNLLSAFGVPALTALPKEQYGAFATQLRAMGAKI